MILDYDFHPRADGVRLQEVPGDGVLLADDDVFVSQLLYDGGIVQRRYAFREHWFRVGVTTDLSGRLVETAPEPGTPPYAYVIDLATPMQREGDGVYAVDLEVDVLVKADGITYAVTDLDDFQQSIRRGLISPAETEGVRYGLDHLVELIERDQLLEYLAEVYPFGDAAGGVPAPPPAPAPRTVALADVPLVQPGKRLTWAGESKA